MPTVNHVENEPQQVRVIFRQLKDALPKDYGTSPSTSDAVAAYEGRFDGTEAQARELQKQLEAHTRGLNEYYDLRKEWSGCLKKLLIILVVFQCILVLLVGCKWLDFIHYQMFLKIQATDYFLQIVGMCYVVVKYLFKDPRAITVINQPGSDSATSPSDIAARN